MKLSKHTLSDLADMICGGQNNFPYRSSWYLTEFFTHCDMEHTHDGSSRKSWVQNVLEQLNLDVASSPALPSDPLLRVLQELMDAAYFDKANMDRQVAFAHLNLIVGRDGLQAFFDKTGRCRIKNLDAGVASGDSELPRPTWSKEEIHRREALAAYLAQASEDELIENILLPLFQQLGFRRVSVTGHKDKSLEYGKDLWMKYQLPTGHVLYFGLQAKRGKLDSAGKSRNENVTEVLNQVRMMLAHPLFDPDTNKKVLPDHVFVACGGEITKQAKNWLAEKLDSESRRHLIFMERDEIIDLGVAVNLRLPDTNKAS
jgi:hypothetical protein